MADEESNYKVEYLDCAEDAPEEERVFTWIARAGKARVTYNSGAVYEGEFNDEKMKHGQGKYTGWPPARKKAPRASRSSARPTRASTRTGRGMARDRPTRMARVYTGEWKESKMHGVGTYKYKASDDISLRRLRRRLEGGRGHVRVRQVQVQAGWDLGGGTL